MWGGTWRGRSTDTEAGPVFPGGWLEGFTRAQAIFSRFLPLPCPLSRNANIEGHLSVLVLFNLPFIRLKHHLRISFSLFHRGLPLFCSFLSQQELQERVVLPRFLLPGFRYRLLCCFFSFTILIRLWFSFLVAEIDFMYARKGILNKGGEIGRAHV